MAFEGQTNGVTKNNTPAISVIIPTYRRPESLSKILKALSLQTLPVTDFEVLVVVDGPDEETEGLLRDAKPPYELQWLVQPSKGACTARNLGVRMARAPLLVFLDDDVIPSPGLLALHSENHARERQVVMGGVLLAPDAPDRLLGEATDWTPHHFKRCSALGYSLSPNDISNANLSLLKEDLLLVGGWDEAFAGFGGDDDRDLARRLQALGLHLHFEPRALGSHYLIKGWERWLHDMRQIGRAHLHYLAKYPDLIRDTGIYSWAGGGPVRRAVFFLSGAAPDFLFRFLPWLVRGWGDRLNPRLGRSLLQFAIRLSGGIAYCRGFWENPEMANRIYMQLRRERSR